MTGVQTCALPICFPVTIQTIEYIKTIEGLKGIKETTRHLLLIAEQLGHIDLQRLTKKDLSAIYNKQLSATKRSNYNRAFSLPFEYAIDSKYLLQAPVIPKGTIKAANPRESADGKVITGLINHFLTTKRKSAVTQENAELLALFLMFLESTGIRYGEARNIKYKDILEPRRFQVRILFYLNTDSGDCEHQFFFRVGLCSCLTQVFIFRQFTFTFPHRFSFEFDPVRVVHQPV